MLGVMLTLAPNARADSDSVARAMNVPDLDNIQVSGTGYVYAVGQAFRPGHAWPRMNLVRYTWTAVMSGTTMSGWWGVRPSGSSRRSTNAACMPADFAPMQSNAWLVTKRIWSILTPMIAAALVYVAAAAAGGSLG